MLVRKYLLALTLALVPAILLAQSSGTPSTLRVLTDANGYLVTTAVAQTLPLSQPTTFNNTRLKTDSSGYLQVTVSGALNPISSITLTNGNTISADLVYTGTTGFNFTGQVTLAGDASGPTNWAVYRWGASNKIFLGARTAASTANIAYISGANGYLRLSGGTGSGPISCTNGLDANCAGYIGVNNGDNQFVIDALDTILTAANNITWAARSKITSPANGQSNLTNNAVSAGIGLDYSTDGKLLLRQRAQSSDAELVVGTNGTTDGYALEARYNGTTFAGFKTSGSGAFKFLDLVSSGNLVSWAGGNASVTGNGVIKWRDTGSVTHGVEQRFNNSSTGNAPSISAGGGTGGAIASNSSDAVGRITLGTTPSGTTIVINFGIAWSTAPVCVSNNETDNNANYAEASTTQLTITGVFSDNDVLSWSCPGIYF